MAAPTLHTFGLNRIFKSLVVLLIFSQHSKDLVIKTKDLVYIQSERGIGRVEKIERKTQRIQVVGLLEVPLDFLLSTFTSQRFFWSLFSWLSPSLSFQFHVEHPKDGKCNIFLPSMVFTSSNLVIFNLEGQKGLTNNQSKFLRTS